LQEWFTLLGRAAAHRSAQPENDASGGCYRDCADKPRASEAVTEAASLAEASNSNYEMKSTAIHGRVRSRATSSAERSINGTWRNGIRHFLTEELDLRSEF